MPTQLLNSALRSLDTSGSKMSDDWPTEGLIDLSIHDLPHASSTTEWWYVNCHLTTENGKEISVFASFFEALEETAGQAGEPFRGHALAWALIDPETQSYISESLLDPRTPEIALRQIKQNKQNTQSPQPSISRALKEMLEKGTVPLPDQLMKNKARVNPESLVQRQD